MWHKLLNCFFCCCCSFMRWLSHVLIRAGGDIQPLTEPLCCSVSVGLFSLNHRVWGRAFCDLSPLVLVKTDLWLRTNRREWWDGRRDSALNLLSRAYNTSNSKIARVEHEPEPNMHKFIFKKKRHDLRRTRAQPDSDLNIPEHNRPDLNCSWPE